VYTVQILVHCARHSIYEEVIQVVHFWSSVVIENKSSWGYDDYLERNMVVWWWLVSNAAVWQLSTFNLRWLFVTHFLFRCYLGNLHYPVVQSSYIGDFKLFPLLSTRCLCSHTTVVASESGVWSFVGDWKWSLILPSLISYHEWKVILHAISIQHGTPCFTSLLKEVMLWIFIAIICQTQPDLNLLSPVASRLPLEYWGRLKRNVKYIFTKKLKKSWENFKGYVLWITMSFIMTNRVTFSIIYCDNCWWSFTGGDLDNTHHGHEFSQDQRKTLYAGRPCPHNKMVRCSWCVHIKHRRW
jgi:hypothetical protein